MLPAERRTSEDLHFPKHMHRRVLRHPSVPTQFLPAEHHSSSKTSILMRTPKPSVPEPTII